MDEGMKEKMKALFTTQELAVIESFLDRGFSIDGQISIASIFLRAKEKGITIERVLEECEKEWVRNWTYQHPQIKGSPDLPGKLGMENRKSLENIYAAIGVLSPFKEGTEGIPLAAFKATTRNSVYEFGEADRDGWRTVSRENNPLKFNRGRILYLLLGTGMDIEYVDSDGQKRVWGTTNVSSIEPFPKKE